MTTSAPLLGEQTLADRSIGAIIAETRNLSADQVERILSHQRTHGVRFGEAAIALGFASSDDVMFALAQQFHYPYVQGEEGKQNPELVSLNQPFGVQAESFRAIRSQLMMRIFNESQPRRAIAVVSPDTGDGKTFFAANLAITLAQLGGRTLLVDADLRSPRLHQVFGLENKVGLSGILSGRAESQVIRQIKSVPSLFVLPVGATPPNPVELVERPAFGLLIRELISKFDYVVVDTPAAQHGSDAGVIAARCGAALMIARRNNSRMQALASMLADVADSPTIMVGAVINDHQ
ncbi:polysaccharide biosynthesis tyrosine autokinase [Roseateles sp. NT4]|uniref:polysaccharide biosynthesis tyrosine autokinase n=1 Tax=Roseateles sp. NT4 TaxID=3453715 RepID=UPI003EEB3026